MKNQKYLRGDDLLPMVNIGLIVLLVVLIMGAGMHSAQAPLPTASASPQATDQRIAVHIDAVGQARVGGVLLSEAASLEGLDILVLAPASLPWESLDGTLAQLRAANVASLAVATRRGGA